MVLWILGHVIWVVLKECETLFEKVQTIKKWQSSTTMKGVRSFLGLANFYKKFIKDFLALARPLFELPTKELSFEW